MNTAGVCELKNSLLSTSMHRDPHQSTGYGAQTTILGTRRTGLSPHGAASFTITVQTEQTLRNGYIGVNKQSAFWAGPFARS